MKKERKAKQDATRELQALKRASEQQFKESHQRLKESDQRLEAVQRDAEAKVRAATAQAREHVQAVTLRAEAAQEQLRRELELQQAQAAQTPAPDAVRRDLLEGAHITTLSQAQLHELQMQLGRLFTTRIPEELNKRKEAEVKEAQAKLRQAELKEAEARQGAPVCVVCLDGPCSMLFLPCRHMKTCGPCSVALVMCPMCRAPIQEKFSPF